jgi:hypothetical protein
VSFYFSLLFVVCLTSFIILYRLKQLDNVDSQKLEKLGSFNKDAYDAVLWLRQNKDKFRMEIIEPPIISLTVPDKNFQYAVETCMSNVQLKVRYYLFDMTRVH